MKRIFRLFLILFLTVTTLEYSNAQEDVLRPQGKPGYDYVSWNPIIIGIEGGLNLNFFSQKMTWDPNYNNSAWDGAKSGFGISPYISFLVDFPLNSDFGIQVKATADFKYVENEETGIVTAYNDPNPEYREKFSFDLSSLYAGLSILFRVNLIDNMVLTVGPVLHFPVGDWERTRTVVLPDYPSLNNSYNDDVDNKTRVGLELGLGWKIPVSKNIWVVPQGRFQFMPTVIADNELAQNTNGIYPYYSTYNVNSTDRILHSLQLGVAVWFGL